MSILVDRPPNFDQILAAFPNAADPGVIFAFGEHIYNPSGKMIPPALVAHEMVHLENQKQYVNPEYWWKLYIADAEFRYSEELHAHVAEYRAQLAGLDRNRKSKLMMATAARLVAPLYAYKGKGMNTALSDLRRELNR